jgi:threonine synthase
MVTQEGDNTYVIGIEGNFDDAQNGVKAIFADTELEKRLAARGYLFSSANSINIGRLVPQVVYYFYAYFTALQKGLIREGEEVNFAVPTGNFGNILAGYYAKKLGLPVRRLICASNENRVLYDFLLTGTYDRNRKFMVTMSPSMDILVSSNLERLLFEAGGKEEGMVRELMQKLQATGRYQITEAMRQGLLDFFGGYATEAETARAIREVFVSSGYLIDPHTAVAYAVYQKFRSQTGDETKAVVVATASPFKFPGDVMASLDGKYRGADEFALIREMSLLTGNTIPQAIKDLGKRPVLHSTVCTPEEMRLQVEKILGL